MVQFYELIRKKKVIVLRSTQIHTDKYSRSISFILNTPMRVPLIMYHKDNFISNSKLLLNLR